MIEQQRRRSQFRRSPLEVGADVVSGHAVQHDLQEEIECGYSVAQVSFLCTCIRSARVFTSTESSQV